MHALRSDFEKLIKESEPTRHWIASHLVEVIYFGFFALLAIMSSKNYWAELTNIRGYQLTDWGITYAGGFIRRGLVGQGILEIAQRTGMSFATITAVIAILCNLIFTAAAAVIFRPLCRNHWIWLLLYAPAYYVGGVLTGFMYGHKDVLLLALGGLLFAGAVQLKGSWRTVWVLTGLALTIPLILSHEGFVIYLPVLFVALSALRLTPMVIATTALIVIGLGLAMVSSIEFSGTLAQRDAMLAAFYGALPVQFSIRQLDEYVALWFVGQSLSETYSFVVTRNLDALKQLPAALVLAFGPLLLAARMLRVDRAFSDPKGRISAWLIGFSALLLAVLMPLVIDWMRFFILMGILIGMAVVMRLRVALEDDLDSLPGAHWTPENESFRFTLAWMLFASLFLLKPGKVSPDLIHFGWNDVLVVILIGVIARYRPVPPAPRSGSSKGK
ncbi:MAG TPA: hypothetical protein VGC40_08125 [Paenirhodobacter sp.]